MDDIDNTFDTGDPYHYDIFYDTFKLSLEKKKKILLEAKRLSFDYQIDKLDCDVSLARQEAPEITWEDMIEKLSNSCHFVIIHRRGYESWKDSEFHKTRYCMEIGFSTFTPISYYLWIYFSEDLKDEFIKKFKLKEKII